LPWIWTWIRLPTPTLDENRFRNDEAKIRTFTNSETIETTTDNEKSTT
jgi:hypothetical protein